MRHRAIWIGRGRGLVGVGPRGTAGGGFGLVLSGRRIFGDRGGLLAGEGATIFDEGIGAGVTPPDESVRARRGEFGGVPLGAVGEEGFRDLEGAKDPVENR